MGIVCELIRIPDSNIEELRKKPFDDLEEFLDENYSNIDAEQHKEDIVFYMDKGWDIARFLLMQNDPSKENLLKTLDQKFIKSDEVWQINNILHSINNGKVKQSCDRNSMIKKNFYMAKTLEHWDDNDFWNYILIHLETYKKAFLIASEQNEGIVVHFH